MRQMTYFAHEHAESIHLAEDDFFHLILSTLIRWYMIEEQPWKYLVHFY